ncbi:MAG: PAS domain-containing protein, partial [Rhodospirillales bacterium]|nr:PAS domain-containing protein [Rhodospirillales bacterium]
MAQTRDVVIELLRASNRPESGQHAVASWAPLRWFNAAKPVVTSHWAGAGFIVTLAAGAVLSLAHSAAEWQVVFGWGLFGLAVIFACFHSWRLGLKWAVRNARKVLIHSLSDSDDALFLTESNGRVIYDTDAFRALIRSVNGDDFLGFANLASLAELIGPASAQNFKRMKGQAADGKRGCCDIDVPAGEACHHWRVSVEPVGTLNGLSLWTFVDVTSQRQFEARREDDQNFLADLLDELPVGLFSTAQDGTLQYVNKTLSSWLSLGGDEPPLALSEFIAAGDGRDDTPDVETDKSGMHGGLRLQGRGGEPFSAYLIQSQKENNEGEFQYSRSLVLREPFTPVVDDGTGGALLRRIPWLFSSSPVGIVLLDLQGTVVDCNRSFLKILGLHRDGVVGWPISERISKEDRDSADTAFTKIVMGIMPATLLEVRVPAGGERELTASFYVSRIDDRAGEVTGLVLHVIDTTEQKNLEVQFNQAQKMQAVGQLAGGVAHDFNNLLTAMGGFCDLLLSRHGENDPDFPDIMQIKQNANRAANLVRQLLAFSRRQTLQPKIFSVTDSLNDLSNLLRRLIGENIELKILHGKDVDLIRTDPGQFDQVIINLAVNARDSMPGGGTISVSTDQVEVETSVQRG